MLEETESVRPFAGTPDFFGITEMPLSTSIRSNSTRSAGVRGLFIRSLWIVAWSWRARRNACALDLNFA